ncbi:hypothetical protein HDJEFDLB_01090 [Escherichia coli]
MIHAFYKKGVFSDWVHLIYYSTKTQKKKNC